MPSRHFLLFGMLVITCSVLAIPAAASCGVSTVQGIQPRPDSVRGRNGPQCSSAPEVTLMPWVVGTPLPVCVFLPVVGRQNPDNDNQWYNYPLNVNVSDGYQIEVLLNTSMEKFPFDVAPEYDGPRSLFNLSVGSAVAVPQITVDIPGVWQLVYRLLLKGEPVQPNPKFPVSVSQPVFKSLFMNFTVSAVFEAGFSAGKPKIAALSFAIGGKAVRNVSYAPATLLRTKNRGKRGRSIFDDIQPSIRFQGQEICGAVNYPIPFFVVEVITANGTRLAYSDSSTPTLPPAGSNVPIPLVGPYVIVAEAEDPINSIFSSSRLKNNQARVNGDGKAIFDQLTPTGALAGPTTIRLSLVTDDATIGSVVPIRFVLNVRRVPIPGCSIAFATEAPITSAYREVDEKAQPHALFSPLRIVPNQLLPALEIQIADAAFRPDESVRDDVFLVEANDGAIRFVGQNGQPVANVAEGTVAGAASFSGLQLYSADFAVGDFVVLSIRPAYVPKSILGLGVGNVTLPLYSMPLLVVAANDAIMASSYFSRIAFDPYRNEGAQTFRAEGLAGTASLRVPFPTIYINLLDPAGQIVDPQAAALNGGSTSNTAMLVELKATHPIGSSAGVAPIALLGNTVQQLVGGTAAFTNLSFAEVPVDGAYLEFSVVDVQNRAINGFAIRSGHINVVASTAGAFSVTFPPTRDFGPFVGPSGLPVDVTQQYLATSEGVKLPRFVVLVLNSAGNVDKTNSELVVTATVAGGACRGLGMLSVANQGIVVFDRLTLYDCNPLAGIIRLHLVAGSEGQINFVQGFRLFSPRIYFANVNSLKLPVSLSFQIGPQNFLSTSPGWTWFQESITLPPVNLQLNNPDGSLSSSGAANIVISAVGANVEDGRTSQTPKAGMVATANGVASFSQMAIVNLLPGRKSTLLSFCAEALPVACVAHWMLLTDTLPVALAVTTQPDTVVPLSGNTSVEVSIGRWKSQTGFSIQPGIQTSAVMSTMGGATVSLPTNSSVRSLSVSGTAAFDEIFFTGSSLQQLVSGLVIISFSASTTLNAAFAAPQPRAYATYTVGPAIAETVKNELPLVAIIGRPKRLFNVYKWARDVAGHFQVDPHRIIVSRAVEARFSASAFATRVEFHIGAPYASSRIKASSGLLTNQIISFRDTCSVGTETFIQAVLPQNSPVQCDAVNFRENVESARHCEVFKGRNARCDCFDPIFEVYGQICQADPLMQPLCGVVQSCNRKSISPICNKITPNLPLRIFIVVAGTAGSIILIALLKYSGKGNPLSSKPKLKHSVDAIERSREHHNEVFM